MPLAISPCRSLCSWSAVRGPVADDLFQCSGCGSQWEPSQGWTPRQHDGTVPRAVLDARVSAASAGAVGTAGS